MRIFRFGMHLWIAFTSVLSFVAGWILLAHAPKPSQAAPVLISVPAAPMPTLAPLPNLNFGSNSGGSVFQNPPIVIQAAPNPPPVSVPMFRTGGS